MASQKDTSKWGRLVSRLSCTRKGHKAELGPPILPEHQLDAKFETTPLSHPLAFLSGFRCNAKPAVEEPLEKQRTNRSHLVSGSDR